MLTACSMRHVYHPDSYPQSPPVPLSPSLVMLRRDRVSDTRPSRRQISLAQRSSGQGGTAWQRRLSIDRRLRSDLNLETVCSLSFPFLRPASPSDSWPASSWRLSSCPLLCSCLIPRIVRAPFYSSLLALARCVALNLLILRPSRSMVRCSCSCRRARAYRVSEYLWRQHRTHAA